METENAYFLIDSILLLISKLLTHKLSINIEKKKPPFLCSVTLAMKCITLCLPVVFVCETGDEKKRLAMEVSISSIEGSKNKNKGREKNFENQLVILLRHQKTNNHPPLNLH